MNKIKKEFGQLSGEELFKPITKRLKKSPGTGTAEEEEGVGRGGGADYAIDNFDRTNPFGAEFMPEVETPLPTPPPLPDDYEVDDFPPPPPPITDDGHGHGERDHCLGDC